MVGDLPDLVQLRLGVYSFPLLLDVSTQWVQTAHESSMKMICEDSEVHRNIEKFIWSMREQRRWNHVSAIFRLGGKKWFRGIGCFHAVACNGFGFSSYYV